MWTFQTSGHWPHQSLELWYHRGLGGPPGGAWQGDHGKGEGPLLPQPHPHSHRGESPGVVWKVRWALVTSIYPHGPLQVRQGGQGEEDQGLRLRPLRGERPGGGGHEGPGWSGVGRGQDGDQPRQAALRQEEEGGHAQEAGAEDDAGHGREVSCHVIYSVMKNRMSFDLLRSNCYPTHGPHPTRVASNKAKLLVTSFPRLSKPVSTSAFLTHPPSLRLAGVVT